MLRIPNLTLDDHFKLEDFQHDFNFVMESLISVSKNAKDYGITGLEEVDDTDKIQELINERGNIYFPKGTYTLTKMIDVYSNTAITLHPEAVFTRKHGGSMFQTATTTETTGYNGEKRIRFNGGTYKHDGNDSGSNIFSIFHADDVVLNDVTCLNTVGSHAIDIVGSNDIKVLHCKFEGYKAVTENPDKEAIQIDAAGCNAYPIYSPEVNAYDGTPTCNVIIDGCRFTASSEYPSHPTAIGQHGQHALKGSRYKNIRVTNNVLIGDSKWHYSRGIRLMSWENAIIANNHIENYITPVFADMFGTVIEPHGAAIKDDESKFLTVSDEDTLFVGCRNITIANNTINACVSTNIKCGIWFNISTSLLNNSKENTPKHRGVAITGNIITMPSPTIKSCAIDCETTEDVVIDGNTIINNAKTDSIGVNVLDYCSNIAIGNNVYKNITEDNYHYANQNTTNIKRKGKKTLWTGKLYNGKMQSDGTNNAQGDIITLSDNISNYDYLIFEIHMSGTEFRQIDFTKNSTQVIRTLNLTDSGTSITYGLSEFVFAKKSDTTIELNVNKFQNMGTTPATATMNSDGQYIKSITGCNI